VILRRFRPARHFVLLLWGQLTKQAVGLAVWSGCEVELSGIGGRSATEQNRPESVDGNWLVMVISQSTYKLAGYGIEGVDSPVAEVAD
jgi:hypothetical protein